MSTALQEKPPSFAVGWRQVAICFLLLGAAGMIAATYSIVAVPLSREFRPSRTVLMMAMTVLSASCAVLSPLLGRLMDRVSLRVLMVIGGLLLGAGYASLSLATSFNQVLLIFGVVIAPANVLLGPVAATVLLSRWFALRRGRALGIAIAGISAGGFFYPMIIQGLLDTHTWREALQWLGLVQIAWTVPAALLVVSRPEDRGLRQDGVAALPVASQAAASATASVAPITARELLRDPAFWMLAITVAVVTSGMKGVVTNLAPLAMDTGVTATKAATLISVYAGCAFIAKFFFAALSDRVGPRTLIYMALGGFSLGMMCLTQAQAGYSVVALGVGIIGLFGGLMVPMESYLAPRVFGQRGVGRAMGLLAGVILLALLATPPLFGLIFDLTGRYNGIFWTFGGLALLAVLWVRNIRLQPRDA